MPNANDARRFERMHFRIVLLLGTLERKSAREDAGPTHVSNTKMYAK